MNDKTELEKHQAETKTLVYKMRNFLLMQDVTLKTELAALTTLVLLDLSVMGVKTRDVEALFDDFLLTYAGRPNSDEEGE